MDENKWNQLVTEIEARMAANDTKPYPGLAAVGACIKAGNNMTDDAGREGMRKALIQCFDKVPFTPFKKGRGLGLPADVEAAINATLSALRTDLMNCWESSPSIQNNIMRHGRSGGGNYGTADEFADAYVKVSKKRLVDGYRAVEKGLEADYHTVISDGFAISVHQEVA